MNSIQLKGMNILMEFECIVDLDLCILTLIQQKYNNLKYMEKHILDADLYFLRCKLLSNSNINPVSIVMKQEFSDQYNKIYNDIITNDIKVLLKKPYLTSIYDMVELAISSDDSVKITVLCRNELEELYINKLNKSISTIVSKKEDIDMSNYDTIFIKNFKEILLYKGIINKNIFIISYKYNLEPTTNDMPDCKISMVYIDTNKLYLVSPYSNFSLPIEEE